MTETPAFFLPPVGTAAVEPEAEYTRLAKHCGLAVPTPDERIYSITYRHDGEQWTATVGELLKGIEYKTVRSRGTKVERTRRLHDCAMVVAIFAGAPYRVVTDSCINGGGRSAWENPFLAGIPTSVIHFRQ